MTTRTIFVLLARPAMATSSPNILTIFLFLALCTASTNGQCFTVESSDSETVALQAGVLATDQILLEIPEGTYVKDLGLNLCGSSKCPAGWHKISHKGVSGYERNPL